MLTLIIATAAFVVGLTVACVLLLPVIGRLSTNPAFGNILSQAGLREAIAALPAHHLWAVLAIDGDDFKAFNAAAAQLHPHRDPFSFADNLTASFLSTTRPQRHASLPDLWLSRVRVRAGERLVVAQKNSGDEVVVIMPALAVQRIVAELDQSMQRVDASLTPEVRDALHANSMHGTRHFSATSAAILDVPTEHIHDAITQGYQLVAQRRQAHDRGRFSFAAFVPPATRSSASPIARP